MKFVKGVDKVAFYGVPGEGEAIVYHRMKGFDELSKSANPNEYNRKYVDENFERSDVTRYSPSLSFSLDQIEGDDIHDDIAGIALNESIGDDAVRTIIMVDLNSDGENAVQRAFSVIIDGEGGGEEYYKYNGNLKVNGEKVYGTATSADDWQTITFTAANPQ